MALLSDKEAELLEQMAKNPSVSQRELSKKTSMSLGLVNLFIRKFIESGFIRVAHVNKRKMEYILTPQGRQEAARKTHQNYVETIRDYRSIREKIAALLTKLHHSGYDYFSIHGDGELRDLIQSTFEACLEDLPVRLGAEERLHPRAVVLNISLEPLQTAYKGDVVNILEKLMLDETAVQDARG